MTKPCLRQTARREGEHMPHYLLLGSVITHATGTRQVIYTVESVAQLPRIF